MSTGMRRTISALGATGLLAAAVWAAFLLFNGPEHASAGQPGITIAVLDTRQVFQAHPAFHEAMREYQQIMQDYQPGRRDSGDMQRMQQIGFELEDKAFGKMQEDLKRIAEEKGYDYIMDSTLVIVGGKDITEEVLERLGQDVPEDLPPIPSHPGMP